MNQSFRGLSVLVTGAGGSIGSELCRRIVADGALQLVMVSLTESGLYQIDRKLKQEFPDRHTSLVPLLGSFGDFDLMEHAIEDVDVVIHAGAHKHVPLCESNPIAAIKNNVLNTEALIEVCSTSKVKKFCLISSDKAVNPTSVMGATKAAAEGLVRAAAEWFPDITFQIVRFGNVMDSAGSVLPLWREQIAAGGPLTITDTDCTRYFMTIADAVRLIKSVTCSDEPSGTYLFDMGKPRNMAVLANELMRQMNADVPVKIIGLRPGEKLVEELHHGGELEPTVIPMVNRLQLDRMTRNQINALDEGINELNLSVDNFDAQQALETLWKLIK